MVDPGDAAPQGRVAAAGRSSGPRVLAVAAACAAAALLVHLPSLALPFVYDDVVTVAANPALAAPLDLARLLLQDRFRPLTSLSYGLDALLWGRVPFGFHLGNLILHLLNVVVLFVVARELGRRSGSPASERLALATALLFAVHPLLGSAVWYVSARAELLAAAWFLAGVLAWLRWPERLAPVAACTLLAAASKEHGLMLPLVLVAAGLLLPPGADRARARPRTGLLALGAAVALLGALRVFAHLRWESELPGRSPWQNLLMEFGVVWRYIRLLVAPSGLALVHEVAPVERATDALAVLAGAGLLVLLLVALRLGRRFPLAPIGALWFLLALAPSSSLLPLAEPMAEHRVYLAGAGLLLVAGDALSRLPRAAFAVALLALALPAAALSRARLVLWADPVALWADAARRSPRVWLAHYGHGDALRDAGRCREALAAYEQAIRLLPAEPQAWVNRGGCLALLGRTGEAEQAFARALELDPGQSAARDNLRRLRDAKPAGAAP